MRERRGEKK
jgi:hypothetical protein